MRWIVLASKTVAAVILIGIVVVTMVAIFYRYALGTPIIITEELSRVLLILMAYCGSISIPHLREHMAIEIVYDMCPPGVQRLLDNIHYLLGTCFLAVLAYSGYELSRSMGGIKLPAMQFPISYIFTIVAAACGVHAIVYAKESLDGLTGRLRDEAAPIEPEHKVAL